MKKWIFIGCMILIGIGFILFLRSTTFQIQQLHYQGNRFVSQKSLDIYFTPLVKKNILFGAMRFSSYKKKCIKQYAQISSIDFSMKFPNYFWIIIKEKQPAFLLITPDSQYFIANDGTLLNTDSSVGSVDNPDKIIIIKGLGLQLSDKTHIHPHLLKTILAVVLPLKKYLLEKNIQVEFKTNQEVVLLKDDLLPIKIGTTDALEQKFKNLKNFLKYVQIDPENPIQFIDLRLPNKVIVKYGKDTNEI